MVFSSETFLHFSEKNLIFLFIFSFKYVIMLISDIVIIIKCGLQTILRRIISLRFPEERVLTLAFCDLKPVSVTDERGNCTYIIGSVIAVYNANGSTPLVYSWDMVKSVAVSRRDFKLTVGNSHFVIPYKVFDSDDTILRAIAIIECHQKEYGFAYQHEKRMLPLKTMYVECAPGRETYIGEGVFDEGETAAAFIALLNFKLIKFLWLIAILIMLVTLGVIQLNWGITRDKVLYYIPISIAIGGIVALLVYIIAHAIARARFKSRCSADLASRQAITFVVSRAGFAVCESCVYESRDLIPWGEIDYFVESDKMFILYRNGAVAAYIPKKAFNKKHVGGVADILALSIEQR